MLLQINITNFALIEKLSISFEKGFNILSGETGAGKSILIDAINYVLGGKFNKDLIRTGEDRTYVEAIFTVENDKTKELLNEYSISFDDEILIISRETFQTGKSIAKINGKSLILSAIKEISSTLIDIHGQHENQNLLDSSKHLFYLDSFCGDKIGNILVEYREKYEKLNDIDKKLKDLYGRDDEREKIIDYLKFQIEEISAANLKQNEDVELEEQYTILTNSEKIAKSLEDCYGILYSGNDEQQSVYDSLGIVIKELSQIEKFLDKIKNVSNSIQESYYNLEESIEELRDLKSSIYFDEKELEYVNNRIYQISSIKKKYGKSIQEILEYKNKLQNQLQELENSEEIIEKLKEEKIKLLELINKDIETMHKIRKQFAAELEKKVYNELKFIGLEKSEFKIEVLKQENYDISGGDVVQFVISTNPGEPLKPLEKIVSGGELSRIMLALKTVFVDKDAVPSIIFDEIDTGISGRIAQSVAEKMYCLSKEHQVFCVTHLPQIACMSDSHYIVSKNTIDKKTFTNINKVGYKEKELEIARMIGSTEVTNITLENSRELISMAANKKKLLNSAS